jgi:FkbM family methyltransferase
VQGKFVGPERSAVADYWRVNIVPEIMRDETAPLRPVLPVQSDLVVIDIGANKGFWAAAFLRTYPGMVERIYMIDASPENHRELSNHFDNMMFTQDELRSVIAFPFAMSSAAGEVTLHTNQDGSALASLYPEATRGHGPDGTQFVESTACPPTRWTPSSNASVWTAFTCSRPMSRGTRCRCSRAPSTA